MLVFDQAMERAFRFVVADARGKAREATLPILEKVFAWPADIELLSYCMHGMDGETACC
jgi:hypothetical protein